MVTKVQLGQVYKPTDKRRDDRRIRVVHITKIVPGFDFNAENYLAEVESRLVGQRTWKPAPSIRLDRLESRHYKLVRK